jgi:serine/threonine protein kinase, bacterial
MISAEMARTGIGDTGTMTGGTLTGGTGDVFGHYRLDQEIGRGGMGVVYRAYDTRTNRVVAIKRMPRNLVADTDFRARFQRESAMAAKLREPHIVPIHDFGEIAGQLFIDMRFVDGVDLAWVLRQRPLGLPRAVDVISQIADALDAAHAEGLVHRDVKPSNVLLVGRSDAVRERGFAYLADFGIAANLGSSTFSRPGLALGTAAYMAPERMAGEAWDHRVDVYSLACMLFEAVTGRRPFPADDLLQALQSHLHRPPPRPSEEVEGLPAALDEVIARGMAKRAADRYDSPGELAAAARTLLEVAPEPPQEENTIRLDDAATAFLPSPSPLPPLSLMDRSLPPTQLPPEPATLATPRRRRRGMHPLLIIAASALAALVLAAGVAVGLRMLQDADAPLAFVASYATGTKPAEVGVSPDGTRAYVSNLDDGTVSVIDTATGATTATIPVAANPNSVVVSADGARVYVSCTGGDTGNGSVAVIDTATRTRTASVAIGGFVDGIALAPDGKRLYAADATSGTVTTVDTATARVTGTPVKVGDHPYGMVTGRNRLYVPNSGSGTVSVIDTAAGTRLTDIVVGAGPVGVAVSPDGSRLYVADEKDGTVTVVDTATNAVLGAPVHVGKNPVGVAVSRDNARVYVADHDSVHVVTAASRAVSDSVQAGDEPVSISVAADGRVFVVGQSSATVTVLRPTRQ